MMGFIATAATAVVTTMTAATQTKPRCVNVKTEVKRLRLSSPTKLGYKADI